MRNALYEIAYMFSAGTIIQIFMTNAGIESTSIGIYTAALSIITLSVHFLISKYANTVKDIKKAITRSYILIAICFLGFLPSCFVSSDSLRLILTKYTMIPASMAQMLFITLYTIFNYKLPYSIVNVNEYGTIMSSGGVISNIFCIAVSQLLSIALKFFEYYTVMTFAFIISTVCILFAAVINQSLKVKEIIVDTSNTQGMLEAMVKLIKMPDFYIFIIPNFLRGISMGLMGMLAVMSINLGYDIHTSSMIVTVTTIATLTGSIFYFILSKRISERILCMMGAILIGSLIFATKNSNSIFLFVCFLAITGKTIIDYAIPTRVYKLIKSDIACMYHSWRLLFTTAGTAIAAAVAGLSIENGIIMPLLIAAFVAQLISSLVYLFYGQKNDLNLNINI